MRVSDDLIRRGRWQQCSIGSRGEYAIDRANFRQGDVQAYWTFWPRSTKVSPSWKTTTPSKLARWDTAAGRRAGDEEIDKLVAERNAAKRKRRLRPADRIRKDSRIVVLSFEDAKRQRPLETQVSLTFNRSSFVPGFSRRPPSGQNSTAYLHYFSFSCRPLADTSAAGRVFRIPD